MAADTLTWTRRGVRHTATKAFGTPGWDPAEHPRDRRGRFIETGATVSIWGGGTGTVTRNLSGGRVEVARDDGQTVTVDNGYITVTARPDGDRPATGDEQPAGEEAPQPAEEAAPQPAREAAYTAADVTGNVARLRIGDEFRSRPTSTRYDRYRVRRAENNELVGQADRQPDGTWRDDQGATHATRDEALAAVASRAQGAQPTPAPARAPEPPTAPPEPRPERPPAPPPERAPEGAQRFTAADVQGNVARLRIGDEFRSRPTSTRYDRYRVRRAEGNEVVGQTDRQPDGTWRDDQGGTHATRDEALAALASRAAGDAPPAPEPAPQPTRTRRAARPTLEETRAELQAAQDALSQARARSTSPRTPRIAALQREVRAAQRRFDAAERRAGGPTPPAPAPAPEPAPATQAELARAARDAWSQARAELRAAIDADAPAVRLQQLRQEASVAGRTFAEQGARLERGQGDGESRSMAMHLPRDDDTVEQLVAKHDGATRRADGAEPRDAADWGHVHDALDEHIYAKRPRREPAVTDEQIDAWGDRADQIRDAPDLADAMDPTLPSTERQAVVRQVWDGFEHGDLTTRVDTVSVSSDGSLRVEGQVHRDGQWAGMFARQIKPADAQGPARAIHEELKLDPEVQGQGFATAFNRRAENAYIRAGVEEVRLTANSTTGGYAWARAGYDFQLDDAARNAAYGMAVYVDGQRRDLEDREDEHGEDHQERIAELKQLSRYLERVKSGKERPTAYELSQLGRQDGDTMWPGKQAMLSGAWLGVKKLVPPPPPPEPTRREEEPTSVSDPVGEVTSEVGRRGVQAYVTPHYMPINGYLRGDTMRASMLSEDKIQAHIADIDEAFADAGPTRAPMQRWRGVRDIDAMFGPVGSMIGGEITDPGYMSTTDNPGTAEDYTGGGGGLVRIHVPEGAAAIRGLDSVSEVVLNRGSRFRVRGDQHTTGSLRVVDLELVPGETTPEPEPELDPESQFGDVSSAVYQEAHLAAPGSAKVDAAYTDREPVDGRYPFTHINATLRAGELPPISPEGQRSTAEAIGRIDEQFETAPTFTEGVRLHRGVRGAATALFGEPGSMVGQVFQDHAYVSTAVDRDRVHGYARDPSRSDPTDPQGINKLHNYVTVEVPAGTPYLFGDRPQGEYVLGRGSQFRVLSDELDEQGNRQVQLRYVGRDPRPLSLDATRDQPEPSPEPTDVPVETRLASALAAGETPPDSEAFARLQDAIADWNLDPGDLSIAHQGRVQFHNQLQRAYSYPDEDTAAALFLRTVAASPPSAPELYRGMSGVPMESIPGEGDTLDLGASSFSEDPTIAERYSSPALSVTGPDRSAVLMRVREGSRSLNIQDHSGQSADQREWVGMGSYRVVSRTERRTVTGIGGASWPVVELELEQVPTEAQPAPEPEPIPTPEPEQPGRPADPPETPAGEIADDVATGAIAPPEEPLPPPSPVTEPRVEVDAETIARIDDPQRRGGDGPLVGGYNEGQRVWRIGLTGLEPAVVVGQKDTYTGTDLLLRREGWDQDLPTHPSETFPDLGPIWRPQTLDNPQPTLEGVRAAEPTIDNLGIDPATARYLRKTVKSKKIRLDTKKWSEENFGREHPDVAKMQWIKNEAMTSVGERLGFTPEETNEARAWLHSAVGSWATKGSLTDSRVEMHAAMEHLRAGGRAETPQQRGMLMQKAWSDLTWREHYGNRDQVGVTRFVQGEYAGRVAAMANLEASGDVQPGEWQVDAWPLSSWAVDEAAAGVQRDWIGRDRFAVKMQRQISRDEAWLNVWGEGAFRTAGLKAPGEVIVDDRAELTPRAGLTVEVINPQDDRIGATAVYSEYLRRNPDATVEQVAVGRAMLSGGHSNEQVNPVERWLGFTNLGEVRAWRGRVSDEAMNRLEEAVAFVRARGLDSDFVDQMRATSYQLADEAQGLFWHERGYVPDYYQRHFNTRAELEQRRQRMEEARDRATAKLVALFEAYGMDITPERMIEDYRPAADARPPFMYKPISEILREEVAA